MNFRKIYIFIIYIFTLFISSCSETYIPSIDKTSIFFENLKGCWSVDGTNSYIDVNWKYKVQVNSLGLKGKLEDSFNDKANKGSLYFNENMAYYANDGMLKDSSSYIINDYVLEFSNPYLVGFYAPTMYAKFSNENLIIYLRRSETLDLLEDDGSFDDWMSIIREVVDDAECDIILKRDSIEAFNHL